MDIKFSEAVEHYVYRKMMMAAYSEFGERPDNFAGVDDYISANIIRAIGKAVEVRDEKVREYERVYGKPLLLSIGAHEIVASAFFEWITRFGGDDMSGETDPRSFGGAIMLGFAAAFVRLSAMKGMFFSCDQIDDFLIYPLMDCYGDKSEDVENE